MVTTKIRTSKLRKHEHQQNVHFVKVLDKPGPKSSQLKNAFDGG